MLSIRRSIAIKIDGVILKITRLHLLSLPKHRIQCIHRLRSEIFNLLFILTKLTI
jgi:hypothetical protein